MGIHVEPGPVAERVAEDLAWLRVPDLSAFPEEQVSRELAAMFSKSGLHPEWREWLQRSVRRRMMGLVTMETAGVDDLPDVRAGAPSQPLFVDVQLIRGIFRDQLVVIRSGAPYFEFVG